MATEWTTWPRATDEELRSWSVARGDDAGRAARSHADVKAENQALRERAEAAEAERAEQWRQRREAEAARDTALAVSDAARRAETAAWNDAIEAAAEAALSSPAGEWGSAGAAASRIRALRLATPTEGEA